MEFLLLGPIEARSSGASPPLGGSRQRAVLADLLLHAGSVVSMDTLIDDIWGADAPRNADAVVQNAVSRLRQALGKELIETRAPGYLLRIDPGAIDARRFERLTRDAKTLPPAERSAALRDALALWRGPAFGDLAFESFLQAEIVRLDELRLTALEDRIEAEIELGRHDDVIPDTAALASQHADRERLCRLLMLALHRAGRDPEALDAYQATRRALDELWGLEPSEETRALQHMILTHAPALAPATPVATVVGPLRRPVSLLLVEALLDDELELEAAGAVLEGVRRAVADVAARHGGALSPESGVELVAAFGVDGAHEDDVVRAARAAVELREILLSRDVDSRQAVGTGRLLVEGSRPVLVGAVVGGTRRALRDAEANDIQLTAVAARLGAEAFELDADGRLLGVRPGRTRRTGELAPLVGRADELGRLQAAFDRVIETGKPSHAVVVGEAGIGKSRLVGAFVEDVPAVVLQSACIAYGEGISFLPLRELAERAASLDATAPELGEPDSADAALAAARALIEHFTADCPVVIVLDDMHWAVPTFLDLVEYLLRTVRGSLLVVSATRPELLERRPAWGEGAIALEALGPGDARELVDSLPERDALDEKLAAAILETAEGVPLFLEQLAAHAAESRLTDDRVPGTLDGLLASRIDQLEPGERAVLSRAAVVGRAFSRESLDALTPEAETRELAGRLDSLERLRLVRPRGQEHEFVHPLVRSAAYDAIARPDRAAMHETFARWLDDREETDELVGTHLERAALDTVDGGERDVRSREAATRLGRAGQRALFAYDNAAAVNLLERATALLEDMDSDRMELECNLGHALKGLAQWDRAVEVLERTAERARVAGDHRLELRAHVELVTHDFVRGKRTAHEAAEFLDAALSAFEQADDLVGIVRGSLMYSQLLDWNKRVDGALVHLERAQAAYRRLGRGGHVDSVLIVHAMRGRTSVPEATILAERSLERHGDGPRAHAYTLVYTAYLRGLAGDAVAAREAVTAARSELHELGEEVGLGTSAVALIGDTESFIGDWGRMKEVFEEGLEYTRDRPEHREWHAYFLARLGEAALEQGDAQAAADLAEQSRAIAVAGDMETSIWWRRVAARAAAAMGHSRKARRLGREALALADDTEEVLLRSGARIDLAEVHLAGGRRAEALSVVREALELLDRKGAVALSARARERFATLLSEREDAVRAVPPGQVS